MIMIVDDKLKKYPSQTKAEKMKVVKDRASTSTLELAGADGYAHLKKLIMLLKMGKPPVNIPPEKLFSAIGGKFLTSK